MIADHLARRLYLYDGEDRRVEVWARNDGAYVVSTLRRMGVPLRWRETQHEVVHSEAAAMSLSSWWMREEQGRMP